MAIAALLLLLLGLGFGDFFQEPGANILVLGPTT